MSIANAVDEIQRTNRRRKAGGNYLSSDELKEALADSYRIALGRAASEVFEGRYSSEELAQMIDYDRLMADAFGLIAGTVN